MTQALCEKSICIKEEAQGPAHLGACSPAVCCSKNSIRVTLSSQLDLRRSWMQGQATRIMEQQLYCPSPAAHGIEKAYAVRQSLHSDRPLRHGIVRRSR